MDERGLSCAVFAFPCVLQRYLKNGVLMGQHPALGPEKAISGRFLLRPDFLPVPVEHLGRALGRILTFDPPILRRFGPLDGHRFVE